MRRTIAVLFALLGVVLTAGIAGAGDNDSGFRTSQESMLVPLVPGSTATPIITVGETVKGHRFESIPDGISLDPNGNGTVDVYVNHETSTVPFPYTPSAPTEANSQNDFDNAQVSLLRLNQQSAGVLNGRMAIKSNENWQRFCSNYLATAKEGFDRPLFFTNEEATDFVFRQGKAWPAPPSEPPAEQAGLVVALDPDTRERRAIRGMGRHNHENSVAIPGYGHPVVLSGDDTFTSDPAQSQLYSYIAKDADAVWNDEGHLFGFVPDDPTTNSYYSFAPGSTMSITGEFKRISRAAAKGTQSQLEAASDALNVFQFVRVEDIAYDKRPGMGNVVYIADSGRGASTPGGPPGNPNPFTSSNGRIWKMVLNPRNPKKVLSLSILIEGDDKPVKERDEIHQPDNLETTLDGLYIQEDPGSSQQFPFGSDDPASPNFDPRATTARIWRYALVGGAMVPVARVDQAADEGPTDVDSAGPGNLGAWESTGIIDASSVFGPGAFLVNIQATTLWIEKAPGDDNVAPPGPDFTFKRAGGQLVLLRLPGA
jgi:uncharacterized protein DUF839